MEGATAELKQVLTTPPPSFTGIPHPHAILHASLEHIRNTGDTRYLFLRSALEVLNCHGYFASSSSTDNSSHAAAVNNATTPISSEEEQLLFHCITGLRSVLLLRWESNAGLRQVLRDLLLQLGVGRYGILPRTVAMACLSGAAAFYKRGWNETTLSSRAGAGSELAYLIGMIDNLTHVTHFHFPNDDSCDKSSLFVYLNGLMMTPFQEGNATTLQMMAAHRYSSAMSASFLSLLVGEFSGGNSSSRYNLPLEFHRYHHQLFENGRGGVHNSEAKSGLDSTLELGMTSLSNLVGYILNNSNNINDNNNNSDNSNTNNANTTALFSQEGFVEMSTSLLGLTSDAIGWEFGAGKSKWELGTSVKENSVLLRPPKRWREALINPSFLGAVFQVYAVVRVENSIVGTTSSDTGSMLLQKRMDMAHQLRQLLLQLSSIALGPIFQDENEHGAYASFLLDGCLNALEKIVVQQQQQQPQHMDSNMEIISSEIVDLTTILSRITTNFGVQTLSRLPTFQRFLLALCTTGKWLLDSSLAECKHVKGDVECMEGVDWKNDAIAQILQCSDAIADDFWLVSGKRAEALAVSEALASLLAPLYGSYCTTRVQMSSMEEHFMTSEGADLDDIREEISALGLEEEMTSAASLGRLNVLGSLTTLSGMFQQCTPKLIALFTGPQLGDEMTQDMASLLEEVRMLIVCACHLLTDECLSETPAIPSAVSKACIAADGSDNAECICAISGLIDMLKQVAEAQATRVSAYPGEAACSPLLSKTLLWFFRRFAAAYVFPTPDDYKQSGGIYEKWAAPESAQPVVNFCSTLCLLYFCNWPLEKEVQDESTALLLALAKRGHYVRDLLVNSISFEQTVALHVVCAPLRSNQSPNPSEIEAVGANLSPESIRGYRRLPYADRARVLTCLLVGCSEIKNEKASNMLSSCLTAVEKSFKLLVNALEARQVHPQNINATESACLAISLYGGIALASEMLEPERIPHFITPSLPHLSGILQFSSFADDLSICGALLTFFRDYAEQCIGMLDHQQCKILFVSAAQMLKSYSIHHCKNRAVPKMTEELDFEVEQKYNDILCVIQLLINLGTKDFVDVYNESTQSQAMGSEDITEVIFFGLQQILPLMSQGLLQFPTLCQHYFSLVGFTVETYPEKMCVLPFDLFESLLNSLLFGMCHSDPLIGKSSLEGLASLMKQHAKTNALANQLSVKNDIVEDCTMRLIQEVVFQPIIWDRVEPAAMALLPLLASIELEKIATLVNAISLQSSSRDRLNAAFEKLIKPELVSRTALNGREGRMIRMKFKTEFDAFVKDVQSFLITR